MGFLAGEADLTYVHLYLNLISAVITINNQNSHYNKSVVQLTEQGRTPERPEIWGILARQVYGQDEVGALAGGRQHTCPVRGLVAGASVGIGFTDVVLEGQEV